MAFPSFVDFSSWEIGLTILSAVLLWFAATWYESRGKYPPGPIGFPIVGYLPLLGKSPHIKLQQLGKKYGDMFSITLGSSKVIVLNSAKIIREVLSKPEVAGRPDIATFKMVNIDTPFLSGGNHWQEHRRFSLHSFRDLGLGKSSMHDLITDEMNHFTDAIKEKDGQPCDVMGLLTSSMSNNICSLVFGKRCDYNDPERLFMNDTLDKLTKVLSQTSLLIFFTWFTKLPFVYRFLKVDVFVKTAAGFRTFVNKKIEEHKNTLDENNQRDFIDKYLCELKTKLETNQTTTLSESFLVGSVFNFFGAGSETVRTAISWALYIMASYPDIQAKVHEEIASVIGSERDPSFLDMKDLPYTQSVLTEVQRWKTVAPLGVLRRVIQDVEIGGYRVPKGTLVMPNLWAAHQHPDDWEDPDHFKPGRFLSSDEKSFVKSENYIPFACGKRACPGEGLAVTEVFLYFAKILQMFQIDLPKGVRPDFEGELSISYHLKPHKLCFTLRK